MNSLPEKTFPSLQRLFLTLLALLALMTPQPASAGGGRVNPDGTFDLSFNFRFPPTPADVLEMYNRINAASQVLWDASEGRLRLGHITLTAGAADADQADVWVFMNDGRPNSDIAGLGHRGAHVNYFIPWETNDGDHAHVRGAVLAHELGHLALGLYDEYAGSVNCGGFCIEEDGVTPTERNQCLMQQTPGLSWTEFCTAGNHDLRRGDGLSCVDLGLLSPLCGGPSRCQFYDRATHRIEASDQQMMTGHSCWEQLVINFPFLRAPAGLPEEAPPAGFSVPVVEDHTGAPDSTVMLVLDRSASMAWNTESDDGPVCPDGTGPAGCTPPRMNFVKAAARAWLALSADSGLRAGVVSFNHLPSYEVGFQAVTAAGMRAFTDPIDSMSPSGSTAIGDALRESIRQFDLDGAPNKSVLLVSDGQNTAGEAPISVVPDLRARGIRVFTVSTGGASSDRTLRDIAGARANAADARSATTLVNVFAQQWANARNAGIIQPLLPYHTDQTQSNLLFRVEDNTPNLTLVLAGNMANMAGFGVRVILNGPPGFGSSYFDSLAADPDMTVINDGYFMIVRLQNLNPGNWNLFIGAAPSGEPLQTGNLTILSDQPNTYLFTSLDRNVVEDTSVPVDLSVMPIYHTGLRELESLSAVLKRPDGSSAPLEIYADSRHGQTAYAARIADMPVAGNYEVWVTMKTGLATFNDPGESIYASAPPNTVSVPLLERSAVQHFLVLRPGIHNDPQHPAPLHLQNGSASTTDSINPRGEVDYYKLPVGTASKVWINVDTGGPQNPGGNSRDSVVTILNASTLAAVETDDNDGSGNGADSTLESADASVIGGRTLAPGSYLIAVRARGTNDVIDPYTLTVVLTDTAPHPESESNNTISAANPISSPVGRRTGAINAAGDVDYYKVDVAAGQVITVIADGDPERDGVGTDLVVDLIAPNPILSIVTLFSADSSANGSLTDPPAEGFRYAVGTNAGTYYIRVAHHSTKGTGTYDLMVATHSSGLVQFNAPSYRVPENVGVASILVQRIGGSAGIVTVRFAAFDGSATAPADYLATAGTLRFQEGETDKEIKIPIRADGIAESDETINLVLSDASGGAALGQAQAVLTIVDSLEIIGPMFISSPQSQSVNAGSPVTFSAVVGGTGPFTYAWLKDEAYIAGATNPVLNIPSTSLLDVGIYSVFVASPAGAALSPGASLAIHQGSCPFAICPANITTNCMGSNGTMVTFSAAGGNPCNPNDFGLVCDPPSGSLFYPGNTRVTCTASAPIAGRYSTCSFAVTVLTNCPSGNCCGFNDISRTEHCQDFADGPFGPVPNPWDSDGVTLTVRDIHGDLFPNGHIDPVGTDYPNEAYSGYHVEYSAELRFATPCRSVSIEFYEQSGLVDFVAYDESSVEVARAQKLGPIPAPETKELPSTGNLIRRVVVTSPNARCKIRRVCCVTEQENGQPVQSPSVGPITPLGNVTLGPLPKGGLVISNVTPNLLGGIGLTLGGHTGLRTDWENAPFASQMPTGMLFEVVLRGANGERFASIVSANDGQTFRTYANSDTIGSPTWLMSAYQGTQSVVAVPQDSLSAVGLSALPSTVEVSQHNGGQVQIAYEWKDPVVMSSTLSGNLPGVTRLEFLTQRTNSAPLCLCRADILWSGLSRQVWKTSPANCISVLVPADMVIHCAPPQGTRVYFNVTATNYCANSAVSILGCTPASGSRFPLGTTVVTCIAGSVNQPSFGAFRVTVTNDMVNCDRRMVLTPCAPGLPGCLSLRWAGDGVLQSASSLGPQPVWSDMNLPIEHNLDQHRATIVVSPNAPMGFFRLRPE